MTSRAAVVYAHKNETIDVITSKIKSLHGHKTKAKKSHLFYVGDFRPMHKTGKNIEVSRNLGK